MHREPTLTRIIFFICFIYSFSLLASSKECPQAVIGCLQGRDYLLWNRRKRLPSDASSARRKQVLRPATSAGKSLSTLKGSSWLAHEILVESNWRTNNSCCFTDVLFLMADAAITSAPLIAMRKHMTAHLTTKQRVEKSWNKPTLLLVHQNCLRSRQVSVMKRYSQCENKTVYLICCLVEVIFYVWCAGLGTDIQRFLCDWLPEFDEAQEAEVICPLSIYDWHFAMHSTTGYVPVMLFFLLQDVYHGKPSCLLSLLCINKIR